MTRRPLKDRTLSDIVKSLLMWKYERRAEGISLGSRVHQLLQVRAGCGGLLDVVPSGDRGGGDGCDERAAGGLFQF